MSLLIKGGTIVTADEEIGADILVDGEKIVRIGTAIDAGDARVIDASGRLVVPGGIDVHTHLEAPVGGTTSSDDFETGTRAAAMGGTTCIIDFATQVRGQRLAEALEIWLTKANKATVDYGLHMIVTDLQESHPDELGQLVREGVTSFKLFMAYPGSLMSDDATILRVLKRAAGLGALVCLHAENGTVIDLLVREALAEGHTAPMYHGLARPPITESEATHRAIAIAEIAGAPLYIVHVSTVGSVREIDLARRRGLPVFGETCPHYLLLTAEELRRPGFEGAKYVLTPPLRGHEDQGALWDALADRTLQVVSTDHCPFFYHGQKDRDATSFVAIPNGGPGIEHRLQLLYHHGVNGGRFPVTRWVDLVSTTPAKMFGLFPRKGTIAVGSDADMVIWNPRAPVTISSATHHMNVDYSLFEGFRVTGNAETVVSRGEMIVHDGTWLGRRGRGQFIKRDAFEPSRLRSPEMRVSSPG